MKEICIFVASSREMVAERLALSDIVLAHEDGFAEQGLSGGWVKMALA